MFKTLTKAEVEFEYLEEIGHEGKNSKVFIAHDKQLDANIVVKEIDIKHFSSPDDYFDEAKILYKATHSNVVDVKYACKCPNNIYIAMPYYKEGSLKKIINTRFLSVREIIRYSLQIISGLHTIHSKKLIHFDIKPDNILISDSNEALISDFGLAKPTNLSGLAGQDRPYIKQRPPEAFDYDHFDLRYDIYQFGVTLYRMCNGDAEFYSQFNSYLDSKKELDRSRYKFACKNGRFPDRTIYANHIPKQLVRIINKCLEPSPDNRYSSILEVSNDLAKIDGNILDWEYSKVDHSQKWTKKYDDKTIFIEVNESSQSLAKKIFDDGKEYRITEYCSDNISNKELKEFFERF